MSTRNLFAQGHLRTVHCGRPLLGSDKGPPAAWQEDCRGRDMMHNIGRLRESLLKAKSGPKNWEYASPS
jgi:hypothetical protein